MISFSNSIWFSLLRVKRTFASSVQPADGMDCLFLCVHSKAGSASVWPGFQGVLQGTGGGEHPRQLCDGVRADGWGDGLRLPPDDWQQNPSGVRDFTSSSDERGDKCSGARHNWLIDLLEGLIIILLFCLYSPSSSVEQSCIMTNPISREQQASLWNERLVIFHVWKSTKTRWPVPFVTSQRAVFPFNWKWSKQIK